MGEGRRVWGGEWEEEKENEAGIKGKGLSMHTKLQQLNMQRLNNWLTRSSKTFLRMVWVESERLHTGASSGEEGLFTMSSGSWQKLPPSCECCVCVCVCVPNGRVVKVGRNWVVTIFQIFVSLPPSLTHVLTFFPMKSSSKDFLHRPQFGGGPLRHLSLTVKA